MEIAIEIEKEREKEKRVRNMEGTVYREKVTGWRRGRDGGGGGGFIWHLTMPTPITRSHVARRAQLLVRIIYDSIVFPMRSLSEWGLRYV